MVVEAGAAAGYMIAWVARKACRVAGGVYAEVDAVLDAGLEKLHAAVAGKLGGQNPALEDLADEAAVEDGAVSELTRQRVELEVTAAARKDEEFGRAVTELVARVQAAETAAGISVAAGADSRVFVGDVRVEACRSPRRYSRRDEGSLCVTTYSR